MQIASHVLAYNVNRFIKATLRNIEPHVDKIYVAHSRRPWGYSTEARTQFDNPTTIADIHAAGIGTKLEIIEGDWETEEAMRNACLERAKGEGFDWLMIQDADELYPEKCWEQIRRVLAENAQQEHYGSTWYNFWKSSHYVIVNANGEIKQANAGMAVRCRTNLKFIKKRMTNAQGSKVIDSPCYHYGYVMSDDEMLQKISTWGHANDFNAPRWYRIKWLNWEESTRYLHPTDPVGWNKAIRFPLEQPDFAEEFALPISQVSNASFCDKISEKFYNSKSRLIYQKSTIKSMIKNNLFTIQSS